MAELYCERSPSSAIVIHLALGHERVLCHSGECAGKEWLSPKNWRLRHAMVLPSISMWLLVFFVMLAIFGFDGALIDIWRITPSLHADGSSRCSNSHFAIQEGIAGDLKQLAHLREVQSHGCWWSDKSSAQ